MPIVVNKFGGDKWRVESLHNFKQHNDPKIRYIAKNFLGIYDTEEEALYMQSLAEIFMSTGIDGRKSK